MNKIITILASTFLFCFHTTQLNSQTVTRQIVASFANSENPSADIEAVYELARANRVTIEQVDKLSCIPYTYLWNLTGSLEGILATVEGIKTYPRGSSSNNPPPGGCTTCQRGSPSTRTPSPDSLDAYMFCSETSEKPVLMTIIDDGIGETFGSSRNPISYKTFFEPYLWSNPSNASSGSLGSIGYSFLTNTFKPISSNAKHGSAVAYRIVDMLRKANVRNVKLMILQTHNPETGLGTVWNVCRALDFACTNNANIINMSVAGLLDNINPEVAEKDGTSVLEVVISYMGRKKETLVVAAAGNDNQNVSVPRKDNKRFCTASYKLPNLIAVAANARNSNKLWSLSTTLGSNYGASNVHIAAPGENIYSAVPITVNPSGIQLFSGTSLAAPHVAAAAAILASNSRMASFTYSPIVTSILKSASLSGITDLRGVVSSGGRLNTCKALQYYWQNYPAIRAASPVSNTEGALFVSHSTNGNLEISPNPVQSALTLHLSSEQEAKTEIVIQDILGQIKLRQAWAVDSGNNTQTVDVSQLNKGIYFVNIRMGEQNIVQKIIKN